MQQQKTSKIKVLTLIVLLALTLPLFYMLVSRVLLPLEWNEPQFNSIDADSESG